MKIVDTIRQWVAGTPDPRQQRSDLADELLDWFATHEDYQVIQFQPVVGGPLGGESATIQVQSRSTGSRFRMAIYANGVFAEYRDRIEP